VCLDDERRRKRKHGRNSIDQFVLSLFDSFELSEPEKKHPSVQELEAERPLITISICGSRIAKSHGLGSNLIAFEMIEGSQKVCLLASDWRRQCQKRGDLQTISVSWIPTNCAAQAPRPSSNHT
jgi:hypothetical protein